LAHILGRSAERFEVLHSLRRTADFRKNVSSGALFKQRTVKNVTNGLIKLGRLLCRGSFLAGDSRPSVLAIWLNSLSDTSVARNPAGQPRTK
jgi:hypothetical protein